MGLKSIPDTKSILIPFSFVICTVCFFAIGISIGSAVSVQESQNQSIYVGPSDSVESFDEVDTAIQHGEIQTRETPYSDLMDSTDIGVFIGDEVIIQVKSEQLADELTSPTTSPTDRFFQMTGSELTFTINQSNPTAELPPQKFLLGPNNTSVFVNESIAYVIVDTGAVNLSYESDIDLEPELRVGQQYGITMEYGNTTVLEDGLRIEFLKEERDPLATFSQNDHEPVKSGFQSPLAPEPATFAVSTNVEPQDEVILRAVVDNNSVWKKRLAGGTSQIEFDFSNVTPPANITMELLVDGILVQRDNGTIRTPDAALRRPSLEIVGNDSVQGILTVSGTLSHGGRMLVLNESGTVVGHQQISSEDWSEETNLSVKLDNDGGEFEPSQLRIQATRAYSVSSGSVYRGGTNRSTYDGPDASMTLYVSNVDWNTGSGTVQLLPKEATAKIHDIRYQAGDGDDRLFVRVNTSHGGFVTLATDDHGLVNEVRLDSRALSNLSFAVPESIDGPLRLEISNFTYAPEYRVQNGSTLSETKWTIRTTSFRVSESLEANRTSEPEPDTPDETSSDDGGPGFTVGMATFALLLIICSVVIYRRRIGNA